VQLKGTSVGRFDGLERLQRWRQGGQSSLMNVTWADEARRHSMENDIIVQNEANIYCVINSLQNLILL